MEMKRLKESPLRKEPKLSISAKKLLMIIFLNLKKEKNMDSILMITKMKKLEFFENLYVKCRKKNDNDFYASIFMY